MPERRYFSCREIAEYLGVSEKTVRRLIDKNEISSTRIGHSVRVDLPKLISKLEAQELEIDNERN